MAGDWIKIRTELSRDPAVIGMAATLDLDEFGVVGRLVVIWSWADQHTADGHAIGVTPCWLDRFVQCDGFAQAMAAAGWLLVEPDGIQIPDFEAHNGENAKKRAQAAKRKQKQRAAEAAAAAAVPDSVPDASRGERDETVNREEKRRDLKPPLDPPQGGGGSARRKRGGKNRQPLGLPVTPGPGVGDF